MSTTVDQRVVEMRFDNQQFERNVSTTMSTIEKLKAKLNFKGFGDGLKSLSGHTSVVQKNMDVLGQGVQRVQSEFSSLQVIGATCLVNITNAAIRAGKNIVNALTLDPVKTGFNEYETKVNAIQTILANTSSKGENIESVTRVIDELNTYADKTIYNFAEMTKNIGTFTAAGVGLQESADAIQGIANVAAMSGSTSQQASTAMYQLSQALAAGTVKLMDWNSVVNAGMGGEKLQNALKQTAREFGINVDEMIADAGSFRESLSQGWITADVLNTTLQKFTVKGAKEYAQAMLTSGQYTQEQADALMREAQMAEDAATKVKTLTQLWDTLKETAQSGWGKTWELVVGDFEEAKDFFTNLSNTFGPMIDAMSDARNNLLEGALSSKWDTFSKKIEDVGISMDTFKNKLREVAAERGLNLDKLIETYGSLGAVFRKGRLGIDDAVETLKRLAGVSGEVTNTTENMADKLAYFQDVVDKVWAGDFGNGIDRVNALTEANYDYNTVQDLVNKTVDGHRLTLEDLSDAQLASIGCTEGEIEVLRNLAIEAEKTGVPIEELIEKEFDLTRSFAKKSGRELLLESIQNTIQGIIKLCSTLKAAWREVFSPMSSDQLYGIIEGLNTFSKKLIMSDETAEKLKRTFKGLFALIDIISTVLNAGLKLGLQAINAILGYFNLDILDVTASLGDMLVKFKNWIDKTVDVKAAIAFLMPYITKALDKIHEWTDKLEETSIGSKLASGNIKAALSELFNWITTNLSKLRKLVFESLSDITGTGEKLAENGKALAKKIFSGFQNGINEAFPKAKEGIQKALDGIVNFFKNLNYGNIAAGFLMGGMLYTVNNIASALNNMTEKIVNVLNGFTAPFKAMARLLDTIGSYVKAKTFSKKADGILKIAGAIAILAASVYILAKLKPDELQQGLISLGILSGILIALTVVTKILSKNPVNAEISTTSIIKLTAGLLIIAYALKTMSGIENVENAVQGMITALISLIGMMYVVEKMKAKSKVIDASGSMLLKMAIAIGIMAYVIKKAGELDKSQVLRGIAVVGAVETLFLVAIAVSRLAGKYGSVAGSMLLKMSIAMGIMVAVVKLASGISKGEVRKAQDTLWTIEGLFVAIIAVSKLAGANGRKAGSMLIGMSVAMAIMVGVVKLATKMSPEDVNKGIKFIKTVGTMFAILMTVSRIAGENAGKAGLMLIGMSIAMIGLVACIYALSILKESDIQKALNAITQIMGMMAIVVASTGLASSAKGTLVALAVSIGILCGALIALSFLDTKKLLGSTTALSAVMLSFAAVIASTKSLENVKMGKILGVFLGMSMLIGVIGAVLWSMSELGVQNALPNAAALGTLLLTISGSLLLISKMGSMSWGDIGRAGAMMAGLVVILEMLTGVLFTLNKLDIQSSAGNVAALCVLLGMMTLVTIALSRFMGNMSWKDMGVAIVAMAGLAVVLEMFALVLATMTALNVQNGIENAASLTILLGAMAVAMIPIGYMGKQGPKILLGVAAMGLLSIVMGMLAVVLGIMEYMNVQNGIVNATALSILLGTMAVAMIPIGLIGKLGPSILLGVAGMALLSIVVGLLAGVLGLMSYMNVQNGIENATALGILVVALSVAMVPLGLIGTLGPAALIGVGCLAALALVLGLAIIGFQKFIGPGLPLMGMQLSMFAMALEPFITTVKKIDDSAVRGCTNIAEMLLALAGSAALDSVMSLFGGDNWAQSIKQPLLDFGDAMVTFSNKLTEGNFNATAVNAAANAGKMISELQNSLPRTGGKIGDTIEACIGKKDMKGFGDQLVSFGTAMCLFSASVKGIDPAGIEAAATAGKMLAEMADTIPNTGGKLAEFLGDNTIDTFGDQLVKFGMCISMFSKVITSGDGIDNEAITAAAEAGKSLAEMASEIPNGGGKIAEFLGDNQIDVWGMKLPIFGTALKMFSDSIEGINTENVESAAKAAKALAKMAADIPNEGGFISKIVGDNNIATFGNNLTDLGKGMKKFSDAVVGLDAEAVATAAGSVKTVVNKLPSNKDLKGKIDEDSIQKLDAVLPSLMTTLSTSSKLIGNIDTTKIASAVADVGKLTDMLTDIGNSSFGGVDSFVTAINELGTVAVNNFVNAFNNGAEKAATAAKNMLDKTLDRIKFNVYKFKDGGKMVIEYFADGIINNASKAETAVSTMLSNVKTSIRNKYTDFYNAGGYLIDGLKAGIADNAYKAAEAASNAMIEAVNAAKAAAGINSPSKVFYEMGEFTIAGFTNALDDLGCKVRASASNMAENARSGFNNAISSIADAFNSEIGAQPTIRPVLDMSAVTAGAGTINRLFGTPSVGLLSNVSSINSMMANRQNGMGNSDVVSAIDKLRKELGNVGGTTNYINGVTYDDGSNVSDAVATLVRAAKIERRR